jgi:23S rRNA pseudouridine1911/1915/1917 synthase
MAKKSLASGKEKVIAVLNQARALELQAIHQYMNQHYNLDDMDFDNVAGRAVVSGSFENAAGRLTHWLRKVSRRRRSEVAAADTPGAREAILDYRVVDTPGGSSLLEVALQTGRSHQIRVQLAATGHPILGDLKYGAPAALPGGGIALYARRLRFDHPTRDQLVEIVAPPPPGRPRPGSSGRIR